MAASSSSASRRYDVFLSFHGVDTPRTFTSHLYNELLRRGFRTLQDSLLDRGKEIAQALCKAIWDSHLSIVIFSENYADSEWCLDELVHMHSCRDGGHVILPVFYGVEPSVVRKQGGQYKKAFDKHSANLEFGKERVDIWREAMSEIVGLARHHHLNNDAKDDAEFVHQIVKEIEFILNKTTLEIASHPVGIERRVQDVSSLLSRVGSDDIGIVVIWGIGGIGKTTVAKATFNSLSPHFEFRSFLADVRSTYNVDGPVKLQKQFISDLRNGRSTQDALAAIHNPHQGAAEIKRTLKCRKALLVVDDVDTMEQLENLAIIRENLHSGSRVIVTTRDYSCTNILKNIILYEPEGLDKTESLQLFNWYAFDEESPRKEGYDNLLNEIAGLAGGLPLVLKIWGAYFKYPSEIEYWHLKLRELRKIPHRDVFRKLRISFDSLENRYKHLFLDIACFFIGMEKELVVKILKDEAFGRFPELEIELLRSRCLVRLAVNRLGKTLIMMHDVIRDMGREIVRQESENDPGKRSRLWDPTDTLSILRDCSENEAVESIILKNYSSDSDDNYPVFAAAAFKNLRLVCFKNVNMSETCNDMISFKKLKYLQWHGFPLRHMPNNLNMGELVLLNLEYSRLRQLWEETQQMGKLRFLDISCSKFLIKTPNFSGMRFLEELKLHHCTNLEEVDESVSCLHKLVLLDLRDCIKLRLLPLGSIFKLRSLKILSLNRCSSLSPYKETTAGRLPGPSCMADLLMPNCNLPQLSSAIGYLVSLKRLVLNVNNFSSLPESISNLEGLEQLYLKYCTNLHSIPALPRNLVEIHADECTSLWSLPSSMCELKSLRHLSLFGCIALKSIPNLAGDMLFLAACGCQKLEMIPAATLATKSVKMDLSNCHRLEHNQVQRFRRVFLLSYQALATVRRLEFELSGNEIPSWCKYQGEGRYIQFVAPRKVVAWIFCVAKRHRK